MEDGMHIPNDTNRVALAVEPIVVRDAAVRRGDSPTYKEIALNPHQKHLSHLRDINQILRRSASEAVPPVIDMWLAMNGLNMYGDPLDVSYLGGGPLFNEVTGQTLSRLEYILSKHPHLKNLLTGDVGNLNPIIPPPAQISPDIPPPVGVKDQPLQQLMQQIMNLLSGMMRSLFGAPPPYQIPQPTLQPIWGNNPRGPVAVLQREIAKMKNAVGRLEAKIRRYEMIGKAPPKALVLRHGLLKEKLAVLEKQLDRLSQPELQPYSLPGRPVDNYELDNSLKTKAQDAAA